MNIKLIEGSFNNDEAVELLNQLILLKIKFHENKIQVVDNEESIKMREKRIIQLQKDLFELKKFVKNNGNQVSINAEISIS
jgi:hypothetical protein